MILGTINSFGSNRSWDTFSAESAIDTKLTPVPSEAEKNQRFVCFFLKIVDSWLVIPL